LQQAFPEEYQLSHLGLFLPVFRKDHYFIAKLFYMIIAETCKIDIFTLCVAAFHHLGKIEAVAGFC